MYSIIIMSMYYVYMVECSDGTFYTGLAINVKKRVKEHNESKRGAKYTFVRRPVTLKYTEKVASRSDGLKREYQIKCLSRKEKAQLVNNH